MTEVASLLIGEGSGRLARVHDLVLFSPTSDQFSVFVEAVQGSTGAPFEALQASIVDRDFEIGPLIAISIGSTATTMLLFGDVTVETTARTAPRLSSAGAGTWIEHRIDRTTAQVISTPDVEPAEDCELQSGVVPAGGLSLSIPVAAGEPEPEPVSRIADVHKPVVVDEVQLEAHSIGSRGVVDGPGPTVSAAVEPVDDGVHGAIPVPEPEAFEHPLAVSETRRDDRANTTRVVGSHTADVDLSHLSEQDGDEWFGGSTWADAQDPKPIEDSRAESAESSEFDSLFGVAPESAPTVAAAPSTPASGVPLLSDGPPSNLVEGRNCDCGWQGPPSAHRCASCGASVAAIPITAFERPVLAILEIAGHPRVPLSGNVSIGRNPPERPGYEIVRLGSDHSSVSKHHADLVVESWEIHVYDCDSRNGVVLQTPDGGEHSVDPGVPHRVEIGMTICLGESEVALRTTQEEYFGG